MKSPDIDTLYKVINLLIEGKSSQEIVQTLKLTQRNAVAAKIAYHPNALTKEFKRQKPELYEEVIASIKSGLAINKIAAEFRLAPACIINLKKCIK